MIKWTKSHYDRCNRFVDVDQEGKPRPIKPIKITEVEKLAIENQTNASIIANQALIEKEI